MTTFADWLEQLRERAELEAKRRAAARKLKPYLDRIRVTELPVVTASPVVRPPRDAFESRLGGNPWWPAALPFPAVQATREPLRFLAQINFADMPTLDPFPRHGLMQLFIADDGVYGSPEYTRDKSRFHCAFHTDLGQKVLDAIPAPNPGRESFSPLGHRDTPFPLEFGRGTMLMPYEDYRLETAFPEFEDNDDLGDAYMDFVPTPPRIRLGGYSTFLNSDPRGAGDEHLGNISLLTMDSISVRSAGERWDVLDWGGGGVSWFLVREEDLRNCDFSRVHYGWEQ